MFEIIRTATLQDPTAGVIVLFIVWASMIGGVITILSIVQRIRSRRPVLGFVDSEKNFDRWNRQ